MDTLPNEQDPFSAALAAEVRGDASNLKGTDYHLLYSLWLLLSGHVQSVAFFAGNDLLAQPVSPASPKSVDSLSASALALSADQTTDIWIQLKCTSAAWTPSAVLDGNLLQNFVLNAFRSEFQKRTWRVRLVTTSDLRSDALRAFTTAPRSHSELNKKLAAVITSVAKSLKSQGQTDISRKQITKMCLTILAQLADTRTTYRDVLAAQIRAYLSIRLVDSAVAWHVAQQIYGAMLQDAVATAPTARAYDRAWLTEVSGHNFDRSAPLDWSVQNACERQVEMAVPTNYRADYFVPRRTFVNWLDEFIGSNKTLFVLAGRTGTGKSWALFDWARRRTGRFQLFIGATALGPQSTLSRIVGNELRRFTTQSLDDNAILQKVLRPSRSSLGPMVLILDDLRPSTEQPREFARMMGALVASARAEAREVSGQQSVE